jgi:hypothetical protein
VEQIFRLAIRRAQMHIGYKHCTNLHAPPHAIPFAGACDGFPTSLLQRDGGAVTPAFSHRTCNAGCGILANPHSTGC